MAVSNSLSSNSGYIGYDTLFGYGILGNLDLYGRVNYVDYNNLAIPVGFTSCTVNGPAFGIVLKYGFLQDAPVDVSGIVAYNSTNLTFALKTATAMVIANSVTGDMSGGVLIGKRMANLEPYAGVVYHSGLTLSSGATSNYTILELLGGTQINMTKNWNLTLEYSSNSISTAWTNQTNGQIVVAAGYGI